MMKEEKIFVQVLSVVETGNSCILILENGDVVKTSAVQNWTNSCNGNWTIETRNTIYKGYGIKEMN